MEYQPNPENPQDNRLLSLLGQLLLELQRRSIDTEQCFYLDIYPQSPEAPSAGYITDFEVAEPREMH